MGKLTTHVLDTANGRPGARVKIELYRLPSAAAPVLLATVVTNADGRCDTPLLADDSLVVGEYELVFFAGDYFRGQGKDLPQPRFLDRIPIRFGISDPDQHYHVPLLLAPYGYSTYRGS